MSFDNLGEQLMTTGHIWSIEDVWEAKGGFFVARYTERDMPRHTHAHRYVQIQFVLEGSLTHTVNGRQEVLGGGQLLAIPPLAYHQIAPAAEGEAVRYYSIGFMPEFVTGLFCERENVPPFLDHIIFGGATAGAGRPCPKITLDDKTLAYVGQKIEQMVDEFAAEDEGYLPMLRALLAQLMIRIGRVYEKQVGLLPMRESHAYGEVMRACLDYLAHNFGSALHLGDVARRFALSRTSFCDHFKRYTGTTFSAYLNRLRIGTAKNLIALGAASFTEVALAAGFADYSTFTRCFKRETGVAPSEYREQLLAFTDARPDAV